MFFGGDYIVETELKNMHKSGFEIVRNNMKNTYILSEKYIKDYNVRTQCKSCKIFTKEK